MIKRDRTLKEACELAKASYEKKLKEDILNDLEDGDKILYQNQEYYVADANYSDEYCWITDSEEDRYNKKASGWSLKKAYIDKILEKGTELDENAPNLKESVEDIPAAPEGSNIGVVAIISELTQEEFQASDHYNSAIATLIEEGCNDIADLLTEIRADEESHIGVLHKAKAMLDDQTAVKFDDGEKEAQEIVNNPEVVEQ